MQEYTRINFQHIEKKKLTLLLGEEFWVYMLFRSFGSAEGKGCRKINKKVLHLQLWSPAGAASGSALTDNYCSLCDIKSCSLTKSVTWQSISVGTRTSLKENLWAAKSSIHSEKKRKRIKLVTKTRRLHSRSMRKRKQTTPMAAMMSPGTMKDRPQFEETQ